MSEIIENNDANHDQKMPLCVKVFAGGSFISAYPSALSFMIDPGSELTNKLTIGGAGLALANLALAGAIGAYDMMKNKTTDDSTIR